MRGLTRVIFVLVCFAWSVISARFAVIVAKALWLNGTSNYENPDVLILSLIGLLFVTVCLVLLGIRAAQDRLY